MNYKTKVSSYIGFFNKAVKYGCNSTSDHCIIATKSNHYHANYTNNSKKLVETLNVFTELIHKMFCGAQAQTMSDHYTTNSPNILQRVNSNLTKHTAKG